MTIANHSNDTPFSKAPFTVIAKPAGAKCNLDCSYCFYLEKENLYPNVRSPRMSSEVLENYVKSYIDSQPGGRVTFVWQGGEPTLLGVDFYRRVVNLQSKYSQGKIVDNAFQTNGVLIDDDWCEVFKEGNFLIGLSIDGPEDLHNKYRINKGGAGSFKQAMRAIEILKKNLVDFNTLTVLHRHNADQPLQIYRFLKDIGSHYLQFIPIVERASAREKEAGLSLVSPAFKGVAKVTEWSLTASQYGKFLIAVFDEWVRYDVGRVFVQIFDSTLSYWSGYGAELCIFQKNCGRGLAIEHNGDLYACDHYVYPDYRLGNITDTNLAELASSPQQIKFGKNKFDKLPSQCLQCDVLPLCYGGCPKHRIDTTQDGETGLNHFCKAYYRFFTRTRPYMKFMAEELRHGKAPANVMAWARTRSGKPYNERLGRNHPCPCGSGKKFKKCCAVLTAQGG